MKKNISKYIILSSLISFPVISYAQPFQGLSGYLKAFAGILNSVVPLIFGLAMIYFFWGVTQFILHDAGNDKTREDGKKKMIWGIVALFVFVSIYGILGALGDLIGIEVPGTDDASSTRSIDRPNTDSFDCDGSDSNPC